MFYILFLFYAIVFAYATNFPQLQPYDLRSAATLFRQFQEHYHKHYATPEEAKKRFEIFKKNLDIINKLNVGIPSYGIYEYTDWTAEEMIRQSSRSTASLDGFEPYVIDLEKTDTTEFDWRKFNIVTGVRNQHKCGACYAASAVAEVESQHAMRTGNLVELSMQQIIDCSKSCNGCAEGASSRALRDMIGLGGFMTEQAYPYEAVKGHCRYSRSHAVIHPKQVKYYNVGEENLHSLLLLRGPVIVGFEATVSMHNFVIRNGNDTVFKPTDCTNKGLNHEGLLVGFGPDYWIIKNSWGSSYADNGYIKFARGFKLCGLGTYIVGTHF